MHYAATIPIKRLDHLDDISIKAIHEKGFKYQSPGTAKQKALSDAANKILSSHLSHAPIGFRKWKTTWSSNNLSG